MSFPDAHFPGSPLWLENSVTDAILACGLNTTKWQAPLECIAFYESSFNPGAGLADEREGALAKKYGFATDVQIPTPVGLMQQGRSFYVNAWQLRPARFPSHYVGDPVVSLVMAIMHINSELTVSGGYGGIGQVDGSIGLLPRTDRGPGNVLRAWIADPDGFDVEAARSLYRGY